MNRRPYVLTALVCLAAAVPFLAGFRPRAADAGEAPAKESADARPKDAPPDDMRYEVESKRDITYFDGEAADRNKHKLDLYLPKGKKDFPVVMFVHGGAWVFGDRNFFGVYEALGKMFARHGVGAAVISYRLSPGVQHPEHVKDVARAFAWTHKHIADYGGRADELFVCGHSAGGHLISLLATDESYLKAEGLSLRDVRARCRSAASTAFPTACSTRPSARTRRCARRPGRSTTFTRAARRFSSSMRTGIIRFVTRPRPPFAGR